MNIDPQKYHRRSIRKEGYDYSLAGAYFVTMVTQHREYLFGEVVNDEMRENQYGKIVRHAWIDLISHYPQVTLDAFVIMPNHTHGIVSINEIDEVYRCKGGSQTRPYKMIQHGLPEFVRAFKSFSARRINQLRNMLGVAVWQRSFYDRIIRNDWELHNIREYIQTNPQRWQDDDYR
jgi:putative transposase